MLMTMRMAMLMKPLTWSPLTLLTWPGEMVPRWDPSAQVARLHKWHRSLQHGQFSSLRDHHHILNFERLIIMSITVTVMSPLLFNPVRVATIIQDPSKVILESVRRIFHGNYSCQVVCQRLISLFVPRHIECFSSQGKNRAGWGSVSNTGDLVDNVLKL